MDTLLKTRVVADALGVAPKTIQTWVRKYEIPVSTNDRGHYLFDQTGIDRLKVVKSVQMPEEQKRSDVKRTPVSNVVTEEAEKRMDDILRRLDHLERMIEQKADEVVSFQLLQHRNELDDLQSSIQAIEKTLIRLKEMEEKTPSVKTAAPVKKERGRFAGMFSFSG